MACLRGKSPSHLGYVPEEKPNAQGFEESLGFMGGCLDNYSHFFYWVGPNRHDLWHNGVEVWHDGQYLPDLLTNACMSYIEQNKSKPFLIYWAINQPHYPLQGTAKWREKYKDMPEPRREYAESLSTADEGIGKVLAKIDELGLRNNTIICFQSDQGHSMEGPAFGGGGSAGPF
jgi:arylsulfatase A